MAEAFRRVILKPPGLDESIAAQLADGLAASIDAQRSYASKSPHVLQFIGELRQDDGFFYIDHEPATTAWPAVELFDRTKAGADEEHLLRVAAALFDALSAAHGADPPLPRAHGGLCPATVLTTTDGIEKVTDFGFAAAICAALGQESYVNLAVGPPAGESEAIAATSIWEVLSPEEFDREDRICAFVDPDKYGTGILGAFEPGSDIIAAGFLLHLLAERRHPYLHADPDAHRMVEMSEFMAMARYNNARRQDLRESANAGMRLWCELVAKMLARLPQERPSAREVTTALSQYVKPVDAAEILTRRLDSLIQRIRETPAEEVDWEREKHSVQAIAGSEGATPKLEATAQGFISEANARVQLGRAMANLESDEWYAAKQQLDEVLAVPNLPPDVQATAKSAAASLKGYLSLQTELDDIETLCNAAHDAVPTAALETLQEVVQRLKHVGAKAAVPDSLRLRRDSLAEKAQKLLADQTAEIERVHREQREEAERLERERAVDFGKARAWGGDLKEAFDAKEWDLLSELLRGRPKLSHWPDEVETFAADLTRKLAEHIAEVEHQAAIDADAKRSEAWLRQVQTAIQAEDWKNAEQRLADRPSLSYWPADAKKEEQQYRDTIRAYRKKEADRRQAEDWIASLQKGVESKAWNDAAGILADRPTLDFWPESVLNQEPALRKIIEKNLEAIKLEQLRLDRERKQAQDWLDGAKQAAEQERWDDALQALETPPAISKVPDELEKEAKSLRQTYTRKRDEALERLRKERTDQVIRAANGFVSDLLTRRFKPFVDAGLVDTKVTDIEFESEDGLSDGQANLSVGLRDAEGPSGDGIFEAPFGFHMAQGAVQIRDSDAALAEQIVEHVKKRLVALQKSRLGDLFASLGKGVFPKLKLDAKLNGLTERQHVTVALCGEKSETSTLKPELRWDPATLRWCHVDPASFTGKALQVASDAARQAVGPKVFGASKPLKQYESMVQLEVLLPDLKDPSHFPAPLPLEARLSLRPGNRGEPVPLQTVGLTCSTIGDVSLDAALAPAENALNREILQAQNSSRASIESELARRSKAASAKIKIASSPKPIKDARKDVKIELKPRRGDLLTLTPKWHPDSFSFHLEDGWEERLNAFLSEAAAGSKGRGMAVPAVVAVGVLAVVATAGLFMRANPELPPGPDTHSDQTTDARPADGGSISLPDHTSPDNHPNTRDTPQDTPDDRPNETPERNNDRVVDKLPDDEEAVVTTPDDNTNDNAEPEEDLTPPRLPSIEPAIANARSLLAASSYLSDQTARDLVSADETSSPQAPRLRVTVPGLVDASFNVGLAEKDTNGDWTLGNEAERTIETKINTLESLLGKADPIPVEELLSDEQLTALTQYFGDARLELQVGAERVWRLDNDRWTAIAVHGTIVLADQPRRFALHLPDGRLSLQALNGQLVAGSEDDEIGRDIHRLVLEEVARLQQASAQQRIDELAAALAPDDAHGFAPNVHITAPIDAPQEQVRIVVDAWDNILPREYTASWDAATLALTFDQDWTDRADRHGITHDVVWLINHDGLSEGHWFRAAVKGELSERESPGDADWTFSVRAPWAKPGDTGNLGSESVLSIELAASLFDGDASPEDMVDRALIRPSYWPLVEAYAGLADPTDEGRRADLLTGLPGGDIFDAGSLVQPEVNPKTDGINVVSVEGVPQSLSLEVSVGLRVNRNHPAGDQISLDALERELSGLLPPTSAALTLSLSQDNVTSNWSRQEQLVGNLEAARAKITALEESRVSFAARQQLEQRLDTRLNNANAVNPSPADAFAILQEIWQTKNVPAAGDGDIAALTTQLQGRLGRRGPFKPRARIKPTIFAEYFIGPRSAYALTWSAKPDGSIATGPTLIRLCPTQTLTSTHGSGVGSGLGDALFTPIWNAAPQAVDARSLLGYEADLGIVLAPDRLMGLFDLPNLNFPARESYLRWVERGPAPVGNTWQSLAELNTKLADLACGFLLYPSLSDTASEWSRMPDTATEAVRWSAQTLANVLKGG